MSEPTEELPWEATFVANIRRARAALGVSQTELARRVTSRGVSGFHQQTVQRIESGTRPVRLNEAVVIADSLALNLYDTLGPSTTLEAARSLVTFVNTSQARWATHGSQADDLRRVAEDDVDTLEALIGVYAASASDEEVPLDEAWIKRLDEVRDRLVDAAKSGAAMSQTWSKLWHPSRTLRLPDGIDPEA